MKIVDSKSLGQAIRKRRKEFAKYKWGLISFINQAKYRSSSKKTKTKRYFARSIG